MSKFLRALLFLDKHNQVNSRDKWTAIPIQNYTEDFWESDNIEEIDNALFEKYNVPENIREFVRKNIQPKSIKNIIGFES